MKIKAAVVKEKGGKFEFCDVDLSEIKENELLVKVVASGICHTDEFGRQGGIDQKFPAVFGHEGAGIVEKIGTNVKGIEKGDHVAFSYSYCGECDACREGKPYYCENFNDINFGGTASDGETRIKMDGKDVAMFFGQSSFAEYSIVDKKSVVKVDKDVDLSLVAPLGCGIQTGAGTVNNIIKPSINSTIAIFGMGAVGLSALMAANLEHCKTIIAVGGNEKSLELAKELGATHTVNRKKVKSVPDEIKKITGKGVDFAIDTSGVGTMIQHAIDSTAFNGSIFVLGPSGIIESFNVGADILMNMKTLRGTCEGESIAQKYIPEMIRMYKEGKFPIDRLIKVYEFDDIENAFDDSLNGRVIKAVLSINK